MNTTILRSGFFLPLFFLAFLLKGQLLVTDGGDPASLVQNVLMGSGVTASNVVFTGAASSIGTFTTGLTPTNLGLSSGLMLSSGLPSNAIGPNNAGGLGFPQMTPGDALLTQLSNQETFDASILEFDFIPQGDTIRFRYVFGSEEYPEYVVGALMNDIFGFFLSGYDLDYTEYTDRNIALVPGTTNTVVSIGTINDMMPSYPQFYVSNTNGVSIQYDGFTTVLTAWAVVIPCTSYHIKLAIADGGDRAWDSGVFLEEGSFSSSNIVSNITYSNNQLATNTAVEGCVDAIMTFKIPYISTTGFMINYTIMGESSAIYGVDYDSIPSPLLIPVGSDSVTLVIHPHMDGIQEGQEWVGVIVPADMCGFKFDTVYFNIIDYALPEINATDDLTIPCGDTVQLIASKTNGLAPFSYAWTNGITDSLNPVSPVGTTEYYVYVTDVCSNTAMDSVTITVYGPTADAGKDTTICFGGSASLTATGGASYLWNTGATTATIDVTPTVTTTYIVTVTATCFDIDTVVVFVNPLPIVQIVPTSDSICPGTTTQLLASGGTDYLWSSVPADPTLTPQLTAVGPVVSPASGTIYTVTVTDDKGCVNTTFTTVGIRPVPTSDFLIDFHSLCIGDFTLVHYTGTGLPAATYNWDFSGASTLGSGTGPYTISWPDAGTYAVSLNVIQDGCPSTTTTDSVKIIPVPLAAFSSSITSGCPPLAIDFTEQSQLTTASTIYEWYFGNGDKTFLQQPSYTYNKSGVYTITLVVTNAYGCSDSLVKTAYINVFPVPQAIFTIHPQSVSIFDPVFKFHDRSLGNPTIWTWDFGDGESAYLPDIAHTYADTGSYPVFLIIENQYGCVDTAYDIATVKPDNTLYVPNAFTPNGDMHNNIFRAYGENLSDFKMMIFARWGDMVFSSDNINDGWDGTYMGEYLTPDTYTVIIYYRDALGAPHSYYNMVVLIR